MNEISKQKFLLERRGQRAFLRQERWLKQWTGLVGHPGSYLRPRPLTMICFRDLHRGGFFTAASDNAGLAAGGFYVQPNQTGGSGDHLHQSTSDVATCPTPASPGLPLCECASYYVQLDKENDGQSARLEKYANKANDFNTSPPVILFWHFCLV